MPDGAGSTGDDAKAVRPASSAPDASVEGPEQAVARARAGLLDARTALARVTGGAPPRVVLAELAQQLAAELAAHFDELPMRLFTGRVARGGLAGRLLPRHRVSHRVVLGRYLYLGTPSRRGTWRLSRIAILALGADGVLRVGRLDEAVHLSDDLAASCDALPWDDRRLRNVPTRALPLARWSGGGEPAQVAGPAEVLEALSALSGSVAAASLRELELLRRLLGPGVAG